MTKYTLRFMLLLLLTGALVAQAPTYQRVASHMQIMQAFIIPASDALFAIGGQAPASDKEWQSVQTNAIILAESGNLLMMRAPKADNGDWGKFSRMLTGAGVAALTAAKAKDVDKLTGDVSDQLLMSCEACHAKYLKKK